MTPYPYRSDTLFTSVQDSIHAGTMTCRLGAQIITDEIDVRRLRRRLKWLAVGDVVIALLLGYLLFGGGA